MSSQPQINNPFDDTQFQRPEDFLTPQQRLNAIADILATIALRVLREDDENQHTQI